MPAAGPALSLVPVIAPLTATLRVSIGAVAGRRRCLFIATALLGRSEKDSNYEVYIGRHHDKDETVGIVVYSDESLRRSIWPS